MDTLLLEPSTSTENQKQNVKFSYSMSTLSEVSTQKVKYLVDPWSSDNLRHCYAASSTLYSKLLPKFVAALSELQRDNKICAKSWETLVGWWLAATLDIIVARIFETSSIYPPLSTNQILSSTWARYLESSRDLFHLYNDTKFNSWLIETLIKHPIKLENAIGEFDEINSAPKTNTQIVDKFWKVIPEAKKILVGASIGRKGAFKLFFRTGKSVKIISPNLEKKTCKPSPTARDALRSLVNCSNVDELQIVTILCRLIPLSYVENFSNYFKRATEIHPNEKCIIYSNAEVIYDDVFKFVSAFGRTNFGSVVIGQQHGGAYGTSRLHRSIEIESKSVDFWLSWGRFGFGNSLTTPSKHLKDFAKNVRHNKDGDILIILNNYPRFTYWLYDCPQGPAVADWFLYLANFLKAIHLPENATVRVRPYKDCLGWGVKDYIRESIKDSRFVYLDKDWPIRRSIEAARLVITTSNGTSWLEGLVANIPTIALLPEKWWVLNENFRDVFDKMKRAGLLAVDYTQVLEFFNSNEFNDLSSWWNSREVQEARSCFLEAFAVFGN